MNPLKKIRAPRAFPVVAIGASAGGLKAFESLLNSLAPQPGMAFVLVPHLAPQYKSHLTEILARSTKLPVREVKNGDKVAPNQIYILPPNRAMLIKEGILHLSSVGHKTDRLNPIDRFFRSLAEDQKERAIGVLLSGEGSDGTAGLQAIKDGGGATFAQNEETAAHLSMPQSAAVAGCVDFILPPAEIGKKLSSVGDGGDRDQDERGREHKHKGDKALIKIIELLRAVKGVDFEFYKWGTLRRRVQRRMTLSRFRDPEKYLRVLKADPKEIELLFSDILISVTSFFREPESFQTLKATIYPRILKNRSPGAPLRIWVPGCSTGEEAYSHAMNLIEFLGEGSSQLRFHIFATDVNPAVIEKARVGLYSKKSTARISPERLRRFFIETGNGYRVVPAIRERCVFAVQNLVQDPPFTNLDLISCRNLLIYLGPTLQEKALQIFQYALKPRGILMLGRSETVGTFSGRFTPLGVKRKVFSERTSASKTLFDFAPPSHFLETAASFKNHERGGAGPTRSAPDDFDLQGQLDSVLPARYIPNGVIVNGELEILRFLGDTSSYLRPAPGKPSLNLRRMASGELLLGLRAAIHASKQSACAVRKEISAPHAGGTPRRVRIEVLPCKASDLHNEYFLVLFEELAVAEPDKPRAGGAGRGKESRRFIELKEDLAVSSEHLKAIIEEQESTNERLKVSNEELLSSNEELQSINEEYETTKEELQSSNEELITSTEEVGRGNQVLSRANNDLSNLLANINIPVVLLDLDLTVHRFTPSAEKVLALSSDKIGRSVLDIDLPLRLPNLKQLLLNVIKTSHVQSLEVQDLQGRWYHLILRPYRTDKSKTEGSKTEGAVMAFIDIQDRKLSEKNVQRLATVVLDSNDSVIIINLKDRITAWNKGAQKMYGYTEAEALGKSIGLLMPKNMRVRARDLVRVSAAPIETQRRAKDGRILDVLLTVTVLRDDKGRPVEIAKTERDITEQKRAERDRKLSGKTVQRLATLALDSNDAVIIRDLKDRITAWNKGAQKMYGYTEAEALRMNLRRIVPKNGRTRTRELLRLTAQRKKAPPVEIQRRAKSGRILDVMLTVTVLRDDKGRPVELATTERDITAQKRAERERKLSEKTVLRLATSVLDSNDAVIICDLKDRIIAWNKGAQKMYGYTEAEALKMSIRLLMLKNDRISARELVRLSGTPMEIQRRTKDGRILDVLRTVTVLRDDKGRPIEIAKTERDITAQKRAERDRKLSEKNVLRLANSVLDSNDGIIICDLKDRIIAWNKGAQRMYGYTEAQALGMNISRLMPKDKLIKARELVRVSAAPIEVQRLTRGGRILDVMLTVTVLRDDKGRPVEVATTERDITAQKRSEKNVLRLANSVIDSNDGVIICDLKDRIIAWNKGAQKMYGYTEAQALGMNIRQIMPENKLILARELVRVSAAPIEIQRRTKDGRILDVMLTVTVLRDDKGRPVEVATTERDITEQKRAERERKLSEKNVLRLATSVIDSNDGVIICDLEDRIIAWNKGAQMMYGYTEAQALGMNISRLVPKNKLIKARELVQVSAGPVETQRRTKDGRILDVLLTVTVLRDDNGQPVEVATTERDITEQKRAERERKLSEKNVLRLANSVLDSNDGVIICDLKDRIIAWNKGAQKMYGYTEAQALGMNIRQIMPGNKLIRARELVRVSAAPIETQRRTKDGRILDVLLTVTVLRDEKGEPVEVATTERDITEQKRADREFRRLHARVISAQETERKRLARELHDGVGQILSGVKYRLQALPGKMNLSEGAEAKILKVGGFLDHAIAEIRRVSQNLMPAELVDLGLEAALLTLCREFKERAGVHVTVRTVPTDASPEMALALFRIAQEALNNIGKHSKATMVAVNLSREGKEILLSVSDNGIGFKLGAGRSAAGQGIGLGSMRERAASIGGVIEIHSTPGAGTTLSVRAPISGGKGVTL